MKKRDENIWRRLNLDLKNWKWLMSICEENEEMMKKMTENTENNLKK